MSELQVMPVSYSPQNYRTAKATRANSGISLQIMPGLRYIPRAATMPQDNEEGELAAASTR